VPDGIYVDATFGGGGHSSSILKKLKTGKLIAFDHDPDAEQNRINDKRFILLRQNFRYLKNNLKYLNAIPINGLIADIGVSSHQIDTGPRGFSITANCPLDMRMNPGQKLTAKYILNRYNEIELTKVLSQYGEVPNSSEVARSIINYRKNTVFKNSHDLNNCLLHNTPQGRRKKFLAKVYQAIRIEVNDELNALKELLLQSAEVIKPGGRLLIISYHSLEDRIVKNFLRNESFESEVNSSAIKPTKSKFRHINKKIVQPDAEEIKINRRVRSARLRIAEKI